MSYLLAIRNIFDIFGVLNRNYPKTVPFIEWYCGFIGCMNP